MNLLGLFSLLALGLILLWIILTIHTAWMLTHPPRRTYAWAVARALPGAPDELDDRSIRFEQWTFRSRDRDLPIWEIRGHAPDGPVIILTHGWGDSRVTMLSSGRIQALLPLCARLILWDLPGHGDAPGTCTLGVRESDDLRGLVDLLASRPPSLSSDTASPACPAPPPLILYGFSLGAVISLRAAAGNPRVSAIIAEAPYAAPWTPARNVLRLRALPYRSNLPPALTIIGALNGQRLRWWPRAHPPADWLPTAAITQPTLILHGDTDAISPITDGQSLAQRLPTATLTSVPGGEHHTLWSNPTRRDACLAAMNAAVASTPAAG